MNRPWLLAAFLLALAWPAAAQDVYHDNVIVVLDASGSMGEAMPGTAVMKMEAAKHALMLVLMGLPERTHIGLLVFSGSGVADPWVYPLGPRQNAVLAAAIGRPKPHGGTPLGRFIKVGADRLLQARQQQMGYGNYRLLIVTDGEAQDPDLVDAYAPEVIARGLIVDVIGVAMAEAHSLARQAHSYRAANDPVALDRALGEVFAEVAKGDGTGEDAFELLAPLPPEAALAIIRGLAVSGNHPIGTAPEAPVEPEGAISVPASAVQRASVEATDVLLFVGVGLAVSVFAVALLIGLLVKATQPRRRRG